MPTIFRHILWFFCVVLLWTLQFLPTQGQPVSDSAQIVDSGAQTIVRNVRTVDSGVQTGEDARDSKNVLPVAFPAAFSTGFVEIPTPVRVPEPVLPQPGSQKPELEKLTITQVCGEVHLKHLQGPQIDPARILCIETGKGSSWCECKMQGCTGRVWSNSQVAVIQDTGVLYLEKGDLIVQVSRKSQAKYTVIAGDFMCQVEGFTLRVRRDETSVIFQVLEGTVTVYNLQTGEAFRARQVAQPQLQARLSN